MFKSDSLSNRHIVAGWNITPSGSETVGPSGLPTPARNEKQEEIMPSSLL